MSPMKKMLLTIALTSMWSPSFLFIKLAVRELPPLTIASCRIGIAILMLTTILCVVKRSLPTNFRFWWHSTMMAVFASALPFPLFCFAEQSIESAVAGILNGSTTMFTAILAHLFLPSDRLTWQKAVGICLSVSGLLILFAPNEISSMSGTVIGMLAALGAALCYAISHVYGKKYTIGYPQFVAPTAQLIASFVMLLPFALFLEQPYTLPMPSWTALLSVCGLAFFGTTMAFILYYRLMEVSGPTAISMVACFFPVGAMFLGYLFLGEVFTINGLIGAGFILLGMMIVNDVIKLRAKGTGLVSVQE